MGIVKIIVQAVENRDIIYAAIFNGLVTFLAQSPPTCVVGYKNIADFIG